MERLDGSDWIDRENYRKKIVAPEGELEGEGTFMQVVEVPKGNHVPLHRHDTTEEVFYILQSGGRLVINGEELRPEEGDVIVCEPGDEHEVFNNSGQTFCILVFKINYEEDDTEWLE
ncbi:MAG: cupin domain-containing protein [Candidatus Nanohaloarchaeota archaeon QJJ-9]|nr:cupin domain-containing protein [Candidatus Nanohaloarchaeota archaeon QJJ-9]